MKMKLDSRIESLLTSEISRIIHRSVVNSDTSTMLNAVSLFGRFSGENVNMSHFYYGRLDFTRRYLDTIYKGFTGLVIDDGGFLSVRNRGWRQPLTITFRGGYPYLYLGNEFTKGETVVSLTQQDFAQLQCILVNQHPLSNEEGL